MARKRQNTSKKQTAKKKQKTEEIETVVLLSSSEDDARINKVKINEDCSIVADEIPDEIFIVEDKCLPPDPEKAKKIKIERRSRKSRKSRRCSSDEDWQDKPSTSKACRLPAPKSTEGIAKTRPKRSNLTPAQRKKAGQSIFTSDDEEDSSSDSETKRRKKSPIIKRQSKPLHPFFTPPARKKELTEKLPEKNDTPLPEIANLEIETFPETTLQAQNADADVDNIMTEQPKVDQTENRESHAEKPAEMPVLRERTRNKIAAQEADSKQDINVIKRDQSLNTTPNNEQSDDKKAKEELRRKIKEEKRIKEEEQKIKNERKNGQESMSIKYSDDSDEENVENIETPIESTAPVMASHSPDTGNGGENFVERAPEKIAFDPAKKRNFAYAQRPSSSENDDTSTEEESDESDDEKPVIKEEKAATKKGETGFFSNVLHEVFKGAKKETSVKTEVKSEKKDDLPSTSSMIRHLEMRRLESSDEEEQAVYSQEATVSDSDTEPSFCIKPEKRSSKSPAKSQSPNVSLDDTVMDKIFDQTKKKRRSGSGGSSQSVSRQSSTESIPVDEDQSPEKNLPKTRGRGRPKKNPLKAKTKPKKLTVAELKIKEAKKCATPKRKNDESFDLNVYLPSHDVWRTVSVTNNTKASAVIAYIRHDVPDFENKQLALFFFDPALEADDPFLENEHNLINENDKVYFLQYKMASDDKSLKILVQETIEINVPSIVKENQPVAKPKKKTRIVQSFHIVFQRGEGRENEIKAFGNENMTLAALFATTEWPAENVVFEFDGEEYPSETIFKNIEDSESGIIIEIRYDTPEADPETEAEASAAVPDNPVLVQE